MKALPLLAACILIICASFAAHFFHAYAKALAYETRQNIPVLIAPLQIVEAFRFSGDFQTKEAGAHLVEIRLQHLPGYTFFQAHRLCSYAKTSIHYSITCHGVSLLDVDVPQLARTLYSGATVAGQATFNCRPNTVCHIELEVSASVDEILGCGATLFIGNDPAVQTRSGPLWVVPLTLGICFSVLSLLFLVLFSCSSTRGT